MLNRTVLSACGLLALWAYILYGMGNATPYLRDELRLTAFEAGLHGSVLAVGVLAAGLSADTLGRRIGSSWLLDLAVVAVASGLAIVAVAPAAAVSLPGTLLIVTIATSITFLTGLSIVSVWRRQSVSPHRLRAM